MNADEKLVAAYADGTLDDERIPEVKQLIEVNDDLADFLFDYESEKRMSGFSPTDHSNNEGVERNPRPKVGWGGKLIAVAAMGLFALLLAREFHHFKVESSYVAIQSEEKELAESKIRINQKILECRRLLRKDEFSDALVLANKVNADIAELPPEELATRLNGHLVSILAKNNLSRFDEVEADSLAFVRNNERLLSVSDSTYGEVLFHLAKAQLRQGKTKDSLQTIDKAQNLEWLNRSQQFEFAKLELPIYQAMGDSNRVAQTINQSNDLSDILIQYDQLFQDSMDGIPSEEFAQMSYDIISSGSKKGENYVRATINLALAKMTKRKFGEAEQVIASLGDHRPSADSDQFALTATKGALALNQRDFESAFSELQDCLATAPNAVHWEDVAMTHYHLALTCERSARVETAESQYAIALDMCDANGPQSDLAKFMKYEQAEFLVVHGTDKQIEESKALLEANKNHQIRLVQKIRARWIVRADLKS